MDRLLSLLQRRRMAARLVAGFALLLLTILLLAINSMVAIRDMSRQTAELYRTALQGTSHIRAAQIHLMSTGRSLRQMVLAPTFVDRDEARAQLEQAMHDLEEEMAAASQSFRGREKDLLQEFEQQFKRYRSNVDDAVSLIDRSADYQAKATAYVTGEQFNRVVDSLEQLLRRMAAIQEEGARDTIAAMAGQGRGAQRLTLALLAVGLLCGTAGAVGIVRSLKQPDRPYHIIDAIPLPGYHSALDTEEPSMAAEGRPVEPVQTKSDEILENTAEDTPLTDAQHAIISPGPIARIRSDESDPESVELPAASQIVPFRRASILIVGDGESSQAVTVGLMANADCHVTVASNGREAVALLEKNPYDVVLMNMQKPMTDGMDATLEIRKNPAFDSLPIIAMMSGGTHQDRERYVAAGVDGHIARPADPDKLLRALMYWIKPAALSDSRAVPATAMRQTI